MYFFYFDESGSRDPSVGTKEKPRDHIYVLLAVGMYEGQWQPFETAISDLKLEMANKLTKDSKGSFDLAGCEVKSYWLRSGVAREKNSPFLHVLDAADLKSLTESYLQQVIERNTVIMASVIDKRYLREYVTHEILHMKAYEFLLERVQHYMRENHRKHRALIVMDDTSKQLNQAIAMKHAQFQREGNRNMKFPQIVEYPFFARSELSNGIQLADQLAYNVYRAFRRETFDYPYFERLLSNFYRRRDGIVLDGLKVWPDDSPLVGVAKEVWKAYKQKTS